MRRIAFLVPGLVALSAASVLARPVDSSSTRPKPRQVEIGVPSAGLVGLSLSSGAAFNDTVSYGGTLIDGAADPIPGAIPAVRPFKAGRSGGPGGGVWNFNSGVGSNFTEPTVSPKPAGYHHRMEGWTGRDNTYNPLPYFRRSALCVLNGGFSMYAGVTLAEANSFCYAGGQGYGNNWNLTIGKTFNYPGSGVATLSFRYQTDCEPGYDYLSVDIDTTGNGSQADVNITSYTGANAAATESKALLPGITLRSDAGPVTIKFNVTSDGGYSDEDGAYVTVCGHSSIDNITLTGALTDNSDFEAGLNGWAPVIPVAGEGGEWSDIRSLASLPPPLSFCPCAISDSVLVFADDTGAHNTNVDNIAGSPWIDLVAGGDVGRPGKFIQYHGYFELPVTNYIFVQALAAWYPAICPSTGLVYVHPPQSDGFITFFGNTPLCTDATPVITEMSAVIPPSAEQVKVFMGVLSYCQFFGNCTGVSNATPWIDKVSLGVYGVAGAPIVTLRTIDTFQDNFAADGTLNPSSTARVDVNNVKGAANPQPGTALGDTLVVNGDGGNTEVRVVFHVRPGPFTSAASLTAWAGARWTAEPAIGPGWYSARCDTGEAGGTANAGKWMSTLHEADPKFGGGTDTDRGAEGDVNQLSHDIFPDRILTPGSRLDYFVKARYMPPDPRNPGGANWYITPDTTGRNYLEMEVLPSSMAADTSWNCTLYVDHHSDREFLSQRLEELGLTGTLGSGGNNAEGTRFDRYDVNAPSSQQASLGRPLNTEYGASILQVFAYKAIAWHSGSLSEFNIVSDDANNLTAWLTISEIGENRFWGSGESMARSMTIEGEPTTISFLTNVLGVRLTCDTIRLASCPTGSVLDSTYCLPLTGVVGSEFTTALPANARGNGCPDLRSFDMLARNSAIATTKGQLAYAKIDGTRNFASITNRNTIDVDYKTVLDGVPVGVLRNPNGDIHAAARCDITTPAIARADNVFDWFQSPTTFNLCKPDPRLSAVQTGAGGGGVPAFRSSLGSIYPNPMNPTTRIKFTNAREGGRVTLSVFDVTGRLVRVLLDAPQSAGSHEVTWDGRDDTGSGVTSGMYFVKLSTRDATQSRKVVVAK